MIQNLKKNGFVVSKMRRIWWILTWALKSLKNLNFDWFLLCKGFNVWSKKVQSSYLSWHWRGMENLNKNWLVVQKWHVEFGKFLLQHSKVSKLGLWWGAFVQNRKYMSLKFTEEWCVMAMKNDAKLEEQLTCHFKIDIRNLRNFDPSPWKSQRFAL